MGVSLFVCIIFFWGGGEGGCMWYYLYAAPSFHFLTVPFLLLSKNSFFLALVFPTFSALVRFPFSSFLLRLVCPLFPLRFRPALFSLSPLAFSCFKFSHVCHSFPTRADYFPSHFQLPGKFRFLCFIFNVLLSFSRPFNFSLVSTLLLDGPLCDWCSRTLSIS